MKAVRTALAVITKYQSGKTHDQLVAVPLCYLLNSGKTQDEFRRAIQFDDYQRRKAFRNDVLNTVASKLLTLDEAPLRRVAQEINKVTKSGAVGINLNFKKDVLAKKNSGVSCILHDCHRCGWLLGESHA
jgi:hypothetical protein